MGNKIPIVSDTQVDLMKRRITKELDRDFDHILNQKGDREQAFDRFWGESGERYRAFKRYIGYIYNYKSLDRIFIQRHLDKLADHIQILRMNLRNDLEEQRNQTQRESRP